MPCPKKLYPVTPAALHYDINLDLVMQKTLNTHSLINEMKRNLVVY